MKLIDADALENSLGVSDEEIEFKDILREAPTVDAAIVVPCEKCLFWVPYNRVNVKGDTWGVCSNTKSICNGRSANKDWFCADGERIINEND